MERHSRFENLVALISGAGDGIGRATARIFAKEGASVVCVDINGEALTSLASELEVDGSKLQTIEADVLDSDQVQRVLNVTLERFRKIRPQRIGLDHANVTVEGLVVEILD